MTLVVHVGAERVRVPLSHERVRQIARGVLAAEGVTEAMLSIAFISSRVIAGLNERYLGHRRATDVIAFSFSVPAPRARVLGDIYIAPSVARANARRLHVGIREEIARLVVHGALHVLGYDHDDGIARHASPMWRRQERLLSSARRAPGRGA